MQWVPFKLVKITELNSTLDPSEHLETLVFFAPEVFHILMYEVFCEWKVIRQSASLIIATILMAIF